MTAKQKSKNTKKLARLFQSSAVHIASGFLCMGAWAVFANIGHGWPDALKAGLAQGMMTALITLLMKKAIEGVSGGFARRGYRYTALWVTPLIVCSISLCVLITGHSIAKTPELWATIAVPFGVAFGYACLYNYGLHKLRSSA